MLLVFVVFSLILVLLALPTRILYNVRFVSSLASCLKYSFLRFIHFWNVYVSRLPENYGPNRTCLIAVSANALLFPIDVTLERFTLPSTSPTS